MYFKEASLSRDIIHELKYRSREKAGKIIAEWTIERLHFSDAKPDILVTIPLHFRKLRQRGYNQLHLFTDTLSDHYYIPSDHDLLKRNYYSKAQALRNKKHRLETQNMFSIDRPVSGKHILLIDDVFTTGNTLAACAWEILKSGGNKVSVLVMAVDK
ncbi:ComF family protein [Chryseobacterium sp. MYb264]|uniref:ComF family protein n=1 Tax=Chryseobacterium sp. MYb264 TaxID=2745153 RepID=UPI002E1668B9|nr:ComF family protein [Chryseobacterium sp. MYb264]